jgi:hypothetical protein
VKISVNWHRVVDYADLHASGQPYVANIRAAVLGKWGFTVRIAEYRNSRLSVSLKNRVQSDIKVNFIFTIQRWVL